MNRATLAALAVAAALLGVSLARGTWAAGGSDSSCYALTATAMRDGFVQLRNDLANDVPWPGALASLAPAGFVASPTDPYAAAPVCAPGFSLLLAPAIAIGGRDAIFIVTPVFAALLAWSAFLIGRRLAGPWAGVAGAALVATSPIVLFQAMQPMNDIATAALWLGVAAILGVRTPNRVLAAGVLAGLALLVRPNLVPVAGVVAGWLVLTGTGGWIARIREAERFVAGAAPFGALVLALNTTVYGGPLQSGYGDLASMFTWAAVAENLRRYLTTLTETHTLLPWAAVLLPLVRPAAASRGWTWLLLAIAATVIACYLPYRVFPEWWYLRFLLPAVALLVVAGLAALSSALRFLPARVSRPLAVAVVVGVAAFQVQQSRALGIFDLRRNEARFRHTAEAVRAHLPDARIAVAAWESGSLRFHARLDVVNWETLAPEWLDRALAWLAERGDAEPAIVVEEFEEPRFRERFAGQTFGALDWPPRLEIDSIVHVYVPADRARYLAGEPVPTEIVVGSDQRR